MEEEELPDRIEFDDGSFVEYDFTRVEEDDRYPEDVKYRFQYVDSNGDPVLRYDNYFEHEGSNEGSHHKHVRGDHPTPIEYEGSVERQLERFFEEVEELRRD